MSNVVHGARARPDRQPVLLRAAVASDVPGMAAIEAESFSDPWPANAFSSLLSMDYARLIVAEYDRTARAVTGGGHSVADIVGYCIVVVAADEGEIANIAVRPGALGTGVGARLLDDALAAVAANGVQRIFLEVRASNEPAKGLYRSRKFHQIGLRRAYYRDPVEDALVLRWDNPATAA